VIYTSARDQIVDFDRLPVPDFSLVRYAKISLYPVERIRGCGMDCEFCTVRGRPRCASVERLIAQISLLVETRGARQFFIVDDLFGQQRDETVRFCRMLADYQKRIGRRLDIIVQIRWDKAGDRELLLSMRNASINSAAIGFESPIKEELVAMRKRVNPEEMLSKTKVFRKFGFLVHGMFIFGYPNKGDIEFNMPIKERVKRYREFISRAKIDTIQVLLPVPLPGTDLRARLQKDNRVYSVTDLGWQYYDGNFPLFEPDRPTATEDMQWAVKKIMGRFYEFKYMFMIGINIFSFTAMIFFLHNIKRGWQFWYRTWRNHIIRFGGWLTMKEWVNNYEKNRFSEKLRIAKKHLKT
ncbi:MAG: radical SAM protein, partial [Candidatus Omnitrophica bacterium]|nr:radical SAM protein [Candidatus Omnitrophota bacterium]